MGTMWKDHWPQCQLQQFVTLASWILFLVLLHTSYLHSTSPSSGSMRSETSAFELQEKGHSRKIITAAARHILSTEHQANISLEVETGEVLSPATAATGLKQNVLTRIVISKPCENVRDHTGFASACAYVQANTDCHSGALMDYTVIFYCKFAKMQLVGYLLLFIWLGMLFYMLGNTAADYFCCSLEKLTNLLRLPPTVAGVSLLPLGNGAPDVFASIAAFLRSGHSQVGLNSVLGGALFVTSVVAGSVSLAVHLYSQERSRVRLNFCCFLRDMGFFFFTLGILCAIIVAGEISFWKSVAYTSIYVVYGISVAAFEYMRTSACIKRKYFALEPLLAGMGALPPSPSLYICVCVWSPPFSLKESERCLSVLATDLLEVPHLSPRGCFCYIWQVLLGIITELGACCAACLKLVTS
jgi:hypothetical protein